MLHKPSVEDSTQILRRTDELMKAASNRYRITFQVAHRAQYHSDEERESRSNPSHKPVVRAILEMSDELTEPLGLYF
jgi:DNA-directed RNA polymerase subunit omega